MAQGASGGPGRATPGEAGLPVSHGEGGWRGPDGSGEVESSLSGVFPCGRHVAMGAPGKRTGSSVMEVAQRLCTDVGRLRRDMEDAAVEACPDETNRLAGERGIAGTPPPS